MEANPGLNLDPLMSSQVECYPGSDPGLLMELESDEITLYIMYYLICIFEPFWQILNLWPVLGADTILVHLSKAGL